MRAGSSDRESSDRFDVMELELISGELLVPGQASGRVLATDEPLSLWGGLDPESGEVIDRRHPLSGLILAGRVFRFHLGEDRARPVASCSRQFRMAPDRWRLLSPVTILCLGLAPFWSSEILGKSTASGARLRGDPANA